MYWIIFGVFALLSWLVSSSLERKFKKYSQESLPLTGAQVAEKMLRENGITDVKVTCTSWSPDRPLQPAYPYCQLVRVGV